MIYRESGWIAKVEVISTESDEKGAETTLRVIETIQMPQYIKPEAVPKPDTVFTVWKSHNAGAYGGWHLSER